MEGITELNKALSDRYRIEREIGRGGMATVYLANDIKHQRHVALKVLHPDLSAAVGGERFLAEIRVAANLQHPNLLPLFDSGDANGLLYYVMPFVDGETLRHKIERERQLRIEDAVRIGAAVADALEYAHMHGVIHRDLKPENILLHAGHPLVADFGIALAVSRASGERITQTGISLGTPQYMSPEQATGDRAIDRRTDVYSLGAVLYEMLTGEAPHSGSSSQIIVSRLLTERPQSVLTIRPSVPAHVARAVEIALHKLPADRWPSAREFGEALSGIRLVATPDERTVERRASRWTRKRTVMAVAALAAILAATTAAGGWLRNRTTRETLAFSLGLPPDVLLASPWEFPLAISPDGRVIVFVGRNAFAQTKDQRQLYVKSANEVLPRPIPGTAGASRPVFSPDGASIAFVRDGQLRRTSVNGGSSVEILSGRALVDGWPIAVFGWSAKGTIVVASVRSSQLTSVLHTIPAAGGDPVVLTRLDSAHLETEQRWPTVLGDGETILYTSYPAGNDMARASIGIASLSTGQSRSLGVPGLRGLGIVDDHVIYVAKDGAVRASRLDSDHRRAIGQPVTLLEGVKVGGGGPIAAALSPSGTLTYLAGRNDEQELVFADESGARQSARERHDYDLVRASPNGRQVAIDIDSPSDGTAVWVYDRDSGMLRRLTRPPESDDPEWSSDGRWVYFHRYFERRDSAWNAAHNDSLFRVLADGSAPATFVIAVPGSTQFAVHPNGKAVLSYRLPGGPTTSPTAWIRPLIGDTTWRALGGATGAEHGYRFSPDGRWLCFATGESGTSQVFIRPFPGAVPRIQVSTTMGAEPVWSADGRRLFYRDGTHFVAAELDFARGPVVNRRVTLFPDEYDWWGDPPGYDVTRDGRFVLVGHAEERDRVVVIVNWVDEVRRRLRDRGD